MSDDLYREIILDHYRNPRHRGTVAGADVTLEASNPLCGDEIVLGVRLDESGRVADIGFTGRGCSISQASASMMCESVAGLPLNEAGDLVHRFKDWMLAGADGGDLGDLEALSGVRHIPVRIKCAVLPWNALLESLERCGAGSPQEGDDHD